MLLHQLRIFSQILYLKNTFSKQFFKKNYQFLLCFIVSLYFKCNGAESLEEEIQGAIELSPTGHNYRSEEKDQRISSMEKDLLSEALQTLEKIEIEKNISYEAEKEQQQQQTYLCGLEGLSRLFDSLPWDSCNCER